MCTWRRVCIQHTPTHIRLHVKTYFRTCINLRKADAVAGNSLKWALTNSEMIATIAIKLRRHFRDNAFDHDLAKALGIDSNLDFIRTPMKEQPKAAIASATIPSMIWRLQETMYGGTTSLDVYTLLLVLLYIRCSGSCATHVRLICHFFSFPVISAKSENDHTTIQDLYLD